jgi:hypothetical protein
MNAEMVVALLEQNWHGLRGELGEQWEDFTESYSDIVARLPSEPSREDLERTVDAVCELLNRYEYGRGLLRSSQVFASERLLAAASETLSDQERTRQVCNRLRELPGRQQRETQKPKETSGSSAA